MQLYKNRLKITGKERSKSIKECFLVLLVQTEHIKTTFFNHCCILSFIVGKK